jgi:hypothetical protein
VQRLTEAAIRATGGAAGVTAEQVGSLSTKIGEQSGIDDELVQHGANLLLTFRNIRNEAGKGNDVFNQAEQAAVDLSAAGFGSVESASIMLGKALNDPIQGMTALRRAGVTFTAEQQKQIKTLQQSGDVLGAQKVILSEVAHEVGGAARASADPVARLGVIWGNLQEQIGGVVTGPLNTFADFLGNDVIPTVSAAGAAFDSLPGPIRAITGVGAAAAATIVGIGLALNTASNLAGKAREGFSSVGIGIGQANRQIESVEGSVGRAQGALGRLRGAFTGALGILGGPWGIALTAGTALLGAYISKQQQAQQEVQDFTTALQQDSGAIGTNTASLAAHKLEQDGVLATAQKLGFSVADVTQAALGNADALARIRAQAKPLQDDWSGITYSAGYATKSMGDNGVAATNLIDKLAGMSGQLGQAKAAWERENAATQAAKASTSATGSAQDKTTSSTQRLLQAQQALANQLNATAGPYLSLRAADRAYRDSVLATTQSLRTNGHTLDITTAKGRQNQAALDAQAQSALNYLGQLAKQPGSEARFQGALAATRQALIRSFLQFRNDKAAAEKYADAILNIPTAHKTTVTTPGMDSARGKVQGLAADLRKVKGAHAALNVTGSGNLYEVLTSGPFKGKHLPLATGGRVPGHSPTKTADNVPVLATADEHMWTVDEVRGAGGHDAVERLRAMAKAGYLQGLARGGAVNARLPIRGAAGFDFSTGPIHRDWHWAVNEVTDLAAARARQLYEARG